MQLCSSSDRIQAAAPIISRPACCRLMYQTFSDQSCCYCRSQIDGRDVLQPIGPQPLRRDLHAALDRLDALTRPETSFEARVRLVDMHGDKPHQRQCERRSASSAAGEAQQCTSSRRRRLDIGLHGHRQDAAAASQLYAALPTPQLRSTAAAARLPAGTTTVPVVQQAAHRVASLP